MSRCWALTFNYVRQSCSAGAHCHSQGGDMFSLEWSRAQIEYAVCVCVRACARSIRTVATGFNELIFLPLFLISSIMVCSANVLHNNARKMCYLADISSVCNRLYDMVQYVQFSWAFFLFLQHTNKHTIFVTFLYQDKCFLFCEYASHRWTFFWIIAGLE